MYAIRLERIPAIVVVYIEERVKANREEKRQMSQRL